MGRIGGLYRLRWQQGTAAASGPVPAAPAVAALDPPARSSVAPCSPSSRTLRAASRWPAAILDHGCARRLGNDQAGTEKRRFAAEQSNMTACPALPPSRPTRGRCDPRPTARKPASSATAVADLRLRQEAEQPAAGRVERALLGFGLAVREQRSAVLADELEHDLLDRRLPQGVVYLRPADHLATEQPDVVAVSAPGRA